MQVKSIFGGVIKSVINNGRVIVIIMGSSGIMIPHCKKYPPEKNTTKKSPSAIRTFLFSLITATELIADN